MSKPDANKESDIRVLGYVMGWAREEGDRVRNGNNAMCKSASEILSDLAKTPELTKAAQSSSEILKASQTVTAQDNNLSIRPQNRVMAAINRVLKQ